MTLHSTTSKHDLFLPRCSVDVRTQCSCTVYRLIGGEVTPLQVNGDAVWLTCLWIRFRNWAASADFTLMDDVSHFLFMVSPWGEKPSLCSLSEREIEVPLFHGPYSIKVKPQRAREREDKGWWSAFTGVTVHPFGYYKSSLIKLCPVNAWILHCCVSHVIRSSFTGKVRRNAEQLFQALSQTGSELHSWPGGRNICAWAEWGFHQSKVHLYVEAKPTEFSF